MPLLRDGQKHADQHHSPNAVVPADAGGGGGRGDRMHSIAGIDSGTPQLNTGVGRGQGACGGGAEDGGGAAAEQDAGGEEPVEKSE